MLVIRQAVYEDIPRIMRFIDENWKKGHIMAVDHTMFEFQHVEGKQVYYIIAEDTEDGKIYGSMGYIPMNHSEYPAVSTVMIRSMRHPECDMLGEAMSRYFEKNIRCCNMISVGIKKRYAMAVDGIAEGHIGKLKQYYRLRNQEQYVVAVITNKEILHVEGNGYLEELNCPEKLRSRISETALKQYIPYRDLDYICHRYFTHPYYTYKVYQICYASPTESILVMRECQVGDIKVLRVVDYIGRDEDLSGIGDSLNRLLEQEGYEYIDFYCYGIPDDIMRKAGFSLREETGNIIPNYFEPFEQKNIDIYFYTWFMENVHAYRGFGDQDRPGKPVRSVQ